MGRKLGELLVAEGRISEGVLTRALELQGTQSRGLRLGAILLRWGLLPEGVLLESLAAHHRCAAVDWNTLATASPEAVKLLSSAQATRLGAVPYASDRKTVRVAFANPSNLAAIDEVQSITGKRVVPGVATEVRLLQAQQLFYKRPLARDVWTILQKIERPAAPVAAADPVAVSPEAEPGVPSGEDHSQTVEASPETLPTVAADPTWDAEDMTDDAAIDDLVEPAPVSQAQRDAANGNSALTDSYDSGDQTLPILGAGSAGFDAFHNFLDGLPLSELLADRLDPFADDTPLADFIEQALSFYETHPTFHQALASLDDGSVDELAAEVPGPQPEAASILDSTMPSSKRRRESGARLTV